MKDSQVLRLAKNHLIYRGTEFICIAIDQVTMAPLKQRVRLKAWIRTLLFVEGHHCSTYCAWLRHNYPKYKNVRYDEALPGRLSWLDWMITTLESEGK